MLRNVGSNWVVALVTVAVTYVLTPFVVHYLGADGYGTWVVITTVFGSTSACRFLHQRPRSPACRRTMRLLPTPDRTG